MAKLLSWLNLGLARQTCCPETAPALTAAGSQLRTGTMLRQLRHTAVQMFPVALLSLTERPAYKSLCEDAACVFTAVLAPHELVVSLPAVCRKTRRFV
jgi:hypothetical protein